MASPAELLSKILFLVASLITFGLAFLARDSDATIFLGFILVAIIELAALLISIVAQFNGPPPGGGGGAVVIYAAAGSTVNVIIGSAALANIISLAVALFLSIIP